MAISQKEQEYLESLKNGTDSYDGNVVSDKLSRSDRELVIVFNEEEGCFYADTSIPKFLRRLEKKNWICTGTQYYSDSMFVASLSKEVKKELP